MRCPACQTEASGAYCPECGTRLEARCTTCDAILSPNARFCTACGARQSARRASLPWYVAGAALVGLILVVLLPASRPAPGPGAGPAQNVPMLEGGADDAALSGGDAAPPPLTGTPREQADGLFNLIMQKEAQGDSATARLYVPMGIQAYGLAGALDADGLFHLSLLQALGREPQAALATARKILARSPGNLLGLAAAAEASVAVGDSAAARRYYRQYVTGFAAESGRDLPEYREHAAALPQYRAEAQRFLSR